MSQMPLPANIYIYCVMYAKNFHTISTPLTSKTMGEGEYPFRFVEFEDLGAVVSDSSLARYSIARENLMRHELALEEIMQHATILPLRFGMLAKSDEEIRKTLLEAHAEELRQTMAYLDGRKEVGLKIFVDQDRLLSDIVEENEAIRNLRDSLIGTSPQQTHYQRIDLGKMVDDEIHRRRAETAAQIKDVLSPLIVENKEGKLLTDMMILNLACLIQNERDSEFEAAVEALDTLYNGQLTFKYVSHAPAYNFVNIVISWKR